MLKLDADVSDYYDFVAREPYRDFFSNDVPIGSWSHFMEHWTTTVAVALIEENPALLEFFFEHKVALGPLNYLGRLQNDADMSFYISRGFEAYAKRALKGKMEETVFTLQGISFQLDKQACVAIAEEMLTYPDSWQEDSEMAFDLLKQSSLPKSFADKFLLLYPHCVDAPLTKDRFSATALREAAKNWATSQMNPLFQLGNPYLGKAGFTTLLPKVLDWNSHPLKEIVLTEERWKLLLDFVIQHSFSTDDVLRSIMLNATLPRRCALRIFGCSTLTAYHPNNAEVFFTEPTFLKSLSHNPSSIHRIAKSMSAEQLQRFYDLNRSRPVAGSLLCVRQISPQLVAKIKKDHPSLVVDDVYDTPNLWNLVNEATYYKSPTNTPFQDAEFENRLNRVLVEHGMNDIENSPVSWKMELVQLLIELIPSSMRQENFQCHSFHVQRE